MAYLDNNGVLYLWGKIKAHVSSAVAGLYTKPSGGIPASDLAAGVIPDISGKVDKVTGKGLSTNDYTTAEKNKLAAFGSASDYALKSDISSMYKYKGSVATTSDLPSSGNTTGDVWNVEASGMNYAWNGTEWDALGEAMNIQSITNTEIDTICT